MENILNTFFYKRMLTPLKLNSGNVFEDLEERLIVKEKFFC